jgi:hypothetical protein
MKPECWQPKESKSMIEAQKKIDEPQAEETEKEILESIASALHENLPDLVFQLSRIADHLELVTGKMNVSQYSDEKGFIRIANIE